MAKDLGLNLAKVGILGTGLSLLSIVLALPTVYLAKKFGHFKVLLLAILLYGLGYLAIAGAFSFVGLLSIFILIGIGFGVFHPIGFSAISRLSDKNNVGRQMGNFTAWGDVGRIVVSGAVTFLIVAISWRGTALLYGGVILVVLLYLYIFHFRKNYLPDGEEPGLKDAAFKQLLGNRKFILAMMVCAFDNLASSGLFLFLPFLLLSKNIQPTFLGPFAGAFLVGNLLGKAVLGRWSDKLGSAKVFIITELIMAGLIVMLIAAHSLLVIVIASILLGIATRGTVPSSRAMVYQSVADSQNFERANSAVEFGNSIASATVPVVLGLASNMWGINWAFWLAGGFAILAVIPALAFGNNPANSAPTAFVP